jgi:hypothetical protein
MTYAQILVGWDAMLDGRDGNEHGVGGLPEDRKMHKGRKVV